MKHKTVAGESGKEYDHKATVVEVSTGTVVFRNPNGGEGTAFQPKNWKHSSCTDDSILRIAMHLQRVDETKFVLSLRSRELELFLSCLRESFATLSRQDYSLRVGLPIEDALSVATELKNLMESEGLGL
jgi:hypothetical protein